MKKVLLYCLITLVVVFITTQTTYSNESITTSQSNIQVTQNLTSMPLSFTENQGQWDEKVKFRANAGGATMWFASDGAYYQFNRTIESGDEPISVVDKRFGMPDDMMDRQPDSIETMMIKANFVGANINPQMVGVDMIDYKCNYFIGNDESKWRTDIPNYTAVMYEQVYDGIDLKYYGNGKHMEYDFIVEPGADFSQIKIQYDGAESVKVNDNGQLVVTTIWGEVVEQRPVIYQLENGNRIPIEGKYLLQDNSSFGFELSTAYDADLPLVIDPILTYSTYLGGDDYDYSYAIAVDTSGSAYVTGYTESTDFPTYNGYQESFGGAWGDVFITKLNSVGNALIYSTYIGGGLGTGTEAGYGISLDSAGNVFVAGATGSTDFPVVNPFQSTYGGDFNDAFALKLSRGGDTLLYSTFIGGNDNDYANGISIDKSGNAYITGVTKSTNYPTQNAFQNTLGGSFDVFVTKLGSSGNTLLYSTFLGGVGIDYGLAITTDSTQKTYITGHTTSSDFPVQTPFQSTLGGGKDAFVTVFDNTGTTLQYSSYMGGTSDDEGAAITLDKNNNIYLSGKTLSADFPTLNAYQSAYAGVGDVFAAKFNASGDTLVYSTYLGGTGDDYSNGIVVDSVGQAYLTGSTRSTDFPIREASQVTNGGAYDAFVSLLSDDGSVLLVSTYLGGSDWDHGYGIAIDDNHYQYIAGYSWSNDFPTINPYQSTFGGMIDAFVAQFSIVVLDVAEFDVENLPTDFNISQNYPNPFNPTTTIEFNLPTKSNVVIKVYNLLGQEVQQLVDQEFSVGNYKVTWDGTSSGGVPVSTGIYLYRLETEYYVESKKMLLLK